MRKRLSPRGPAGYLLAGRSVRSGYGVGMRVIGVGFGRTGTASVKIALERLGLGRCYHMFNVIEQPERASDWLAVAKGEPHDWDAIFAGFQSTVDWPAA